MGFAEGKGDGLRLFEVLVEADHEEGGGEVVYGPEGADDVGGTGEDEAAGEADIFVAGGGDVGEAGFAGGEGDEAAIAQIKAEDVFDGEAFLQVEEVFVF